MKKISIWQRLLDLIAPRLCVVCGRRLAPSERVICAVCNLHLPRTGYQLSAYDNPMARLFWGIIPVERVAALFYYEASSRTSNILYDLKYHDHPEIGREMGRLMARELAASDFFDGMIMAFGLGQTELRAIVENILNQINITDVEIKVALNNFDNALNFYRKHTLFSLLSDIDIPITEEKTINIASTQWDKFFDETSKQNPDAYKFLIK